jgi:hypothetical protein
MGTDPAGLATSQRPGRARTDLRGRLSRDLLLAVDDVADELGGPSEDQGEVSLRPLAGPPEWTLPTATLRW